MKKRRTRAQIAATKKLVAFNKKRRGKKTAKKTRKKRRTPAQIAATRKLVALNKRRGKKRPIRRKNPQRKKVSRGASHLWVAFVCIKSKVHFAYVTDTRNARVGVSEHKGQSILFRTKARAHAVAKLLSRDWPGSIAGVTLESTTKAQIQSACNGKT